MKEYITKQKRELMECVDAYGSMHFSAADIASDLRLRGSSVGLATVYRFLDKLVANGKLRKFIIDSNSAACYQKGCPDCENESSHNHYHLKCTECGALLHLDCGHVSELGRHIAEEHGFKVDNSRTILYGLCEKCVKKAK